MGGIAGVFDLEHDVPAAVFQLEHKSLWTHQWVNHRPGRGNGGLASAEHLLNMI